MLIVNLSLGAVYKPGGKLLAIPNPERRSSVKIVCSVHQLHLSFCEVLLILDSKSEIIRLPSPPLPPKKKKKKKKRDLS